MIAFTYAKDVYASDQLHEYLPLSLHVRVRFCTQSRYVHIHIHSPTSAYVQVILHVYIHTLPLSHRLDVLLALQLSRLNQSVLHFCI
jgi:hypothetical protein